MDDLTLRELVPVDDYRLSVVLATMQLEVLTAILAVELERFTAGAAALRQMKGGGLYKPNGGRQ
jgi:hypothetical protein